MAQPIKTRDEYVETMLKIEAYNQKATAGGGFHALSAEEADDFEELFKLAEQWEDSIPIMPIRTPKSIPETLELYMYNNRLKQKELAKILEIPEARLSEFLNGKRKLSIDLAKKMYTKLGIEPKFILEHA